eukprot:CAMPEP_0117578430 /NCGR_PEP_ID=MMETSP0784-20121206/64004_1 /TAXON_ID=39447 /ORGANISM="" /LENGTH=118 /DNA_ID=CAMNT_0005378103 /DNA_START=304 /DNA_END=656 /DNA_ORIENTATION=+
MGSYERVSYASLRALTPSTLGVQFAVFVQYSSNLHASRAPAASPEVLRRNAKKSANNTMEPSTFAFISSAGAHSSHALNAGKDTVSGSKAAAFSSAPPLAAPPPCAELRSWTVCSWRS